MTRVITCGLVALGFVLLLVPKLDLKMDGGVKVRVVLGYWTAEDWG